MLEELDRLLGTPACEGDVGRAEAFDAQVVQALEVGQPVGQVAEAKVVAEVEVDEVGKVNDGVRDLVEAVAAEIKVRERFLGGLQYWEVLQEVVREVEGSKGGEFQ